MSSARRMWIRFEVDFRWFLSWKLRRGAIKSTDRCQEFARQLLSLFGVARATKRDFPVAEIATVRRSAFNRAPNRNSNDTHLVPSFTADYLANNNLQAQSYCTVTWVKNLNIHLRGNQSKKMSAGRGFQPSDRHDPHKRELLTTLTARLWHISLVRSWSLRRREEFFSSGNLKRHPCILLCSDEPPWP